MLKSLHPHDKDNDICFFEKGHRYEWRKSLSFVSVTTFLKSKFPEFNADAVITKLQLSNRWRTMGPDDIYWDPVTLAPMTKELILTKWLLTKWLANTGASELGTQLHRQIEQYYNNADNDESAVPIQDRSWTQFLDFAAEYKSKFTPFRTEWVVYDSNVHIAGSIDMVVQNSDDGSFSIYDWKRSKDALSPENPYREFSHIPELSHVPATTYWKYAMQLNMYKYILETNYDMKIRDLHLVRLHPNFDTYAVIDVPDMSAEIRALMVRRM
jgi:hypothetical protein